MSTEAQAELVRLKQQLADLIEEARALLAKLEAAEPLPEPI